MNDLLHLCGVGDVESVASLTAITRNLLPYWLTRFPGHELADLPIADAAKQLRSLAEREDPLALQVFDQQATAIGRLFTLVADVIDPDAYFVGGGVVEAAPSFREWFVAQVAGHLRVRCRFTPASAKPLASAASSPAHRAYADIARRPVRQAD